ncbi:hypothetical protein D9M68_421280 [compost metagenome]
MGELRHIGRTREDDPADHRDDHDRLRHRAGWVTRLLRQCRDGIEAQERIGRDCRTGDRSTERYIRFKEWPYRRKPTDAIDGNDIAPCQYDERDQHGELHQHQHDVHPVGESDADDVYGRRQHNEADNPQPGRNGREGGAQIGGTDQPDNHRQEEIVEQDGPADEEARTGIQRLAGVGVGGSGDRIDLRHDPVARGRQENRKRRDEIGHRRCALACRGQRPERAEHDHRRHIGKPEQHHGPQTKGSIEFNVLCHVPLLQRTDWKRRGNRGLCQ